MVNILFYFVHSIKRIIEQHESYLYYIIGKYISKLKV